MNNNLIRHQFGFAGGSVIGSQHSLVGQPAAHNNQDTFHWGHGRNCSFAVVCDGCSTCAHSEVGAYLISRILTNLVLTLADERLDQNPGAVLDNNSGFWKRVEEFLLNDILGIVRKVGNGVSQTVNDFLLCTIIGTLITPTMTYVVTVGDGTYVVNGEIYSLEPEAGNSPVYIAYQISGTTLTITSPEILHLRVHNSFPTEEVDRMILASDGIDDLMRCADSNLPGKAEKIGSIHQFSDKKFFANPDNVRRRLALAGLETVSNGRVVSSPLKDDTTLITIVRTSPPSTTTTE